MNIWIAGDFHSGLYVINNFYENTLKTIIQEQPDKENWLICLGDFGANYHFDLRDQLFKQALCEYPIKYFVIRGNHEQRASDVAFLDGYAGWEEVEIFGNTCLRQTAYPNIYYAKDEGGIYNIAGRKTLVIPGAYSVDKYYRLSRGWSWFAEEQLTPLEMADLSVIVEGQHFDLVLSHTCPYRYRPEDLFLGSVDQSRVDNTMELWMDDLHDKITFGTWCFAHYHQDRIEAPFVEMFFCEVEKLEDIEHRWATYKLTNELDWWLPKSPIFYQFVEK